MRPTWKEILGMLKPEPYPPDELEWGYKIPSGEYEVLIERLQNITLEGQEIFTRSGMTSFLRMGDTIVGILTADGDMAVSWMGLYIHAVTAQPPIKFVMRNWKDNPSVGVKDGDIFYVNDPLYGGMHLPDQFAFMPIFHKEELIAWAIAGTHQTEAGGIDPGGFCLNATTRYSEGIKLPPIKIGENFTIRDDLMELMMHAVRTPRLVWADVRARVTTADRVRTRIKALSLEIGKETVKGLLRRIIKETEEAARKRVASLNDGTTRAVIFRETSGDTPTMQRIFCTLHKKGDKLLFDFTGTSPEDESPFHQFPHCVLASIALSIFAYSFYDLPVSTGTLAPIDVVAPEGSMLNPHADAACSVSPPLGVVIHSLVNILLSKLGYDSDHKEFVVQADIGQGAGLTLSGINQHGMFVADLLPTTLHGQGQSGHIDRDGTDTFGFGYCPSTAKTSNSEDDEEDRPVLRLYTTQSINSCGLGKHRGGVGVESAYVVYGTPYIAMSTPAASGSKVPLGQGLFGGYPPPPTPVIIVRGSNILDLMKTGDSNVPSDRVELLMKRIKGDYAFKGNNFIPTVLNQGDVISGTCIGGSGYGDVLERDPAAVIEDVKKGIIYEWTAKNVYKVAFDPVTLDVDIDQTRELRQQERETRLREGKPYKEFLKEWERKKPREDILFSYGSWPDAGKIRECMRI
jgi:N-methylhydantoinase B/oxoprolinase/acetone carboxylase alpha subunit